MPFPELKKLARFYLVLCGLCALMPAAGQTGIPLGAELSGWAAIPSNNVPSVICGRLWLDGTNLFYRFAIGRLADSRGAVELKGPASQETNGPLLFVLNPFAGRVAADSLCEAAADVPTSPQSRPQYPIAGGSIGILPEQVPELLSGEWYANAMVVLLNDIPGDHPRRSAEVRGQIVPLDSDGDGVPDYLDLCPGTAPEGLVNSQGCAIEQICPCGGPWKNHGDYVNSLKQVLEGFVKEGLLDQDQSQLLFQSGVNSNCGKSRAVAPTQ